MGDASLDGCGDDHGDGTCPICRGEPLPSEFIARVQAAAAQPRRVMTRDPFEVWPERL